MDRLCKFCQWWGWDDRRPGHLPTRAVCAEQTQKNAERGSTAIIKTGPDESCEDFEATKLAT